MLPLSCLDCEHCYDDDEAIYCNLDVCVKEKGEQYERPEAEADKLKNT